MKDNQKREDLKNADVFILDNIEFVRKDTLVRYLEAVKGNKDDVLLSVNSLIEHIKQM